MRLATVTVAALLIAGCPGLETPVTAVSGRILGASGGAYAYPFGRPDLKAMVGADGRYRIDGVPTSVTAVVLFDGAGRAERVQVELEGGEENGLDDRYGSGATLPVAEEWRRMPLAATVIAAVIPDGGAVATGSSCSVIGTDLLQRLQGAGELAVVLYPLPAGRFEVLGRRDGFADRTLSVDAIAGATVPLALHLDIDADAEEAGCEAGLECENGLHCSAGDGRCYACTADSDCEAGETCELASGLCAPTSGPALAVCSACVDDAGCDAAAGLLCSAGAYCAPACTVAQDCPAGFACDAGRCAAPSGCGDWLQSMGAPCVADGDCRIGTGSAATMLCSAGRCVAP